MIFDIFKKNSYRTLESFYLGLNHVETLHKYPWMALAVNQRTLAGSMLTKELVLTAHSTDSVSIQLAENASGLSHFVFEGKKRIYSGELVSDLEQKNSRVLFNDLLDKKIELEIKYFQDQISKGEFSPRQLEAEEKALEWMRVSFEVLTKAALESFTNPEYLFQTTFFSGINPKTSMHEMRLMTFNLDMTFILLADNNLRVLIYNIKPGEDLATSKPALSGDYSYRKREMLDHFTTLLSVLSKGIHA